MAYQGSLDGLCGLYAIVNAFDLCDIEEDWLGEDIFAFACRAINGWPDVLWDGTDFDQMISMLEEIESQLRRAFEKNNCHFPITTAYPFQKNQPRNNSAYWRQFEQIFSDDESICGIAGMEHPDKHWFAFISWKDSLIAFDSAPTSREGFQRMPRSHIHAGEKRVKKYVLNRRELIVFRTA